MWRVLAARWAATSLILAIQHNTVCGSTLALRTENIVISTRQPSWKAVRDFS